MAAHSNRSPSPLSSRPTNPNPRNSEQNPAPRRSFSGNNPFGKPSVLTNPRRFDPITPANSPSDFGRRRSVGIECTGSSHLKDYEEKENDVKDHFLKASKVQSPAKGSKNFMAPTISAASKFTPSPRKKVLVERNDPVRTSISLSDGKAMFFSTMMSANVPEELESKSEMGLHQNHKNGCSLDLKVADSNKADKEGPPVSKPSKRVSFSSVPLESENVTESLSESVVTDSDSLILESSLKNKVSCSSVSPALAQLDADPSLPPYDPKTNYFSPRPQFLHYKPNPRIGILLNKEKVVDRDELEQLDYSLMDEVMSENLSDSEGAEESQTEDSQKEEFDVGASADMVIGLEESEDNPFASEPSESLPVSTTVIDAISEENLVKPNDNKPWRFSRLMCFSMLMMFLLACASISVMRSPLHDQFVLKDLSLSDLSILYHQSRASAKVNLDWLVEHVNQFSVDSVAFTSKLANEFGKGEKQGPLQFMNLSELQMSTSKGGHLLNEENEELVENLEETELEEELDTETDIAEEETNAEVDNDQNFEEVFDTQDNDVLETEEVSHDSAELVSEYSEDIQSQREDKSADLVPILAGQESELEAAVVETASESAETEKSHDDDINLGTSCELEAAVKVAPKRAEPEKSHDELEVASDKSHDDVKVNSLSESVQSSPTLESPPSEDKRLSQYVMGASSLFAALVAVAAFTHHYKRNRNLSNVILTDPVPNKQTDYAFTGTKHFHQEKQISHNWETEVDVIGESCPSEMSSFQKGSSYSKKETRGASEVQSIERKTRKYSERESLASSSEYSRGSASYGSFTTYERIPIKNADGDEEIITPVRRSSRIRSNQFTSP
ncbi:hypothetical protein CDL12_19590 [Handroanthus impetiginosus]|uniref:Uncharacterized protein n=1 Tax=Handroanthus impetiginosus TaxID=429701 RepID=A0A2G9GRC9_9LAMI|nr:hypothetical protein CDL12_19590 [Handroanthus impetiginosus]